MLVLWRKVRGKFSQHDRNGDGSLDSEEFAALCAELGSPLTPAEVEAALLMLDTDRSGAVSIEEFLRWWSGRC
jgi:Ca2+-binding EF-hand superfamily protein